MKDITPSQMYIALCKAAATVKEDAQMNCPHYRFYVPTNKGDEECMCDFCDGEKDNFTKCGWPHECPMLNNIVAKKCREVKE